MRRRILGSIVVVTTVAVALFGIPLAVGAKSLYRSQEIARLQREAALAAGPLPSLDRQEGGFPRLPPRRGDLAFYDKAGRRVSGTGPAQGGIAVRQALSGRVGDAEQAGELRVAVPILADNRIFGAVEASLPLRTIDGRVHRTWWAMAGLGILVVLVAATIARRQARRLAEPIADLASALKRLGQGDFSARIRSYGVEELDAAGAALDATATRLGAVLARERAFSANASHQLSTPLTGLRLTLESALLAPGAAVARGDLEDTVEEALGEVSRLQETVAELLALARDAERSRDPVELKRLFDDIERAWRRPFASQGRVLSLSLPDDLPTIHGSATAVREILDVLLGNAARHGSGMVTVRAHGAHDGVVVEVQDEGGGISTDHRTIFDRRSVSGNGSGSGAGHGIGLALARSLAEAEGGRLLLRSPGPKPVFALFLAGTPEAADQVLVPARAEGTSNS